MSGEPKKEGGSRQKLPWWTRRPWFPKTPVAKAVDATDTSSASIGKEEVSTPSLVPVTSPTSTVASIYHDYITTEGLPGLRDES